MVQPGPRLHARLQEERVRLGLGPGGGLERERYVGVHVRLGDGCARRGACSGLAEHMPSVDRLLSAYNM